MSLSKIVQESVSSFDKRFCSFNLSADERCKECLHKTFDGSSVADGCGSADEYIKEHLISSQISLLEAELERKKIVLEKLYVEYSKIKEYAKFLDTDSEDANRKKIQVNDERREQREISKAKFSVVEADITYLEEQIAECRKLLK